MAREKVTKQNPWQVLEHELLLKGFNQVISSPKYQWQSGFESAHRNKGRHVHDIMSMIRGLSNGKQPIGSFGPPNIDFVSDLLPVLEATVRHAQEEEIPYIYETTTP